MISSFDIAPGPDPAAGARPHSKSAAARDRYHVMSRGGGRVYLRARDGADQGDSGGVRGRWGM